MIFQGTDREAQLQIRKKSNFLGRLKFGGAKEGYRGPQVAHIRLDRFDESIITSIEYNTLLVFDNARR